MTMFLYVDFAAVLCHAMRELGVNAVCIRGA